MRALLSWLPPRAFVAALTLCGAVAFGVAGCPDKPDNGGKDAGPAPVDAGPGDGGGVDAGPPRCPTEVTCETSEYCELTSGKCLPAKTCFGDDSCNDMSEVNGEFVEDYCSYGSCYCDGQYCKPRTPRCGKCTTDVQCGSDDSHLEYDYVAGCTSFGDGGTVCLPKAPKCGPGYIQQAGSTWCAPVAGSCEANVTCIVDADCDPMSEKPVCDTVRGACAPSCIFDWQSGQSNCPPGQVCHVDGRLLKANNPNFGGGKCGRPCDGESPFVCSEGTVCVGDGDPIRVNPPVKRCRPQPPKCVRDADCPQNPEGHSWGYCERATLACSGGCRVEADCNSGYECVDHGCQPKGCIKGGGANLYCASRQFCCGEAGGIECPLGVNAGQCFDAPNPPWCGDCTTQEYQTPGGVTRPQPSKCVLHKGAAGRDRGLMWHSCDKMNRAMCPSRWQCEEWPQWCKTDADCDGSQGSCAEFDLSGAGLGVAKGCICNSGQTCPSPSVCGVDEETGESLGYCVANWCAPRYCVQDWENNP